MTGMHGLIKWFWLSLCVINNDNILPMWNLDFVLKIYLLYNIYINVILNSRYRLYKFHEKIYCWFVWNYGKKSLNIAGQQFNIYQQHKQLDLATNHWTSKRPWH